MMVLAACRQILAGVAGMMSEFRLMVLQETLIGCAVNSPTPPARPVVNIDQTWLAIET